MKPKTNNKTTVQNENENIAGASHFQAKSLDEILNAFIKRESEKRGEKASSGTNDYLDAFSHTMRFICANMKSFDFNDFLQLSRRWDSPSSELAALYHAFVKELKANHRCNIIAGCYSQSIVKFK